MTESLVGTYVHLAKEARANEALHTLKKVASLVKPIMRARGWKVRQLAEFYPDQTNLLGMFNVVLLSLPPHSFSRNSMLFATFHVYLCEQVCWAGRGLTKCQRLKCQQGHENLSAPSVPR